MDDLFKEGAEQHDFEYNPAAWSMMEEKLDTHDRKKRFLWYMLGIALVAILIGIYNWSFSTEETIVPTQQSPVTTIAETLTDNQQKQSVSKLDITETEEIGIAPTQNERNNKKNHITEDSKVSNLNIGAQNSFQSENTGSLATSEVVSVSSPTVSPSSTTTTFDKINNPASTHQTTITNNREIIGGSLESTSQDERQALSIHLLDSSPFQIEQQDKDMTVDYQKIVDLDPSQLSTNIKPRLVVTVFGATELSSVGKFSNAGPGYRVGAKVGFQFNKKWQLDLGIAYSHKIYGGLGESYTPSDGWFSDIEPTWMDAKCNVLEIPLEVTYFPKGYENSGFFFNAGISSYAIDDEWYGFKYNTDGMDPQLEQRLVKEIFPEDLSTQYHVIGAGRISVGYQKILSSKAAVEIAPYVQIPLTGLGAGKVRMYSTGIQLGLKWAK